MGCLAPHVDRVESLLLEDPQWAQSQLAYIVLQRLFPTRLRTLVVRRQDSFFPIDDVQACAKSLGQLLSRLGELKTLHVTGPLQKQITKYIHSLRHVTLSGMFQVSGMDILDALGKCPGLEVLHLVCENKGAKMPAASSNLEGRDVVLSELCELKLVCWSSYETYFAFFRSCLRLPQSCDVQVEVHEDYE